MNVRSTLVESQQAATAKKRLDSIVRRLRHSAEYEETRGVLVAVDKTNVYWRCRAEFGFSGKRSTALSIYRKQRLDMEAVWMLICLNQRGGGHGGLSVFVQRTWNFFVKSVSESCT